MQYIQMVRTANTWAYSCDNCGKRIVVAEDPMEAQEMLHWEHRGAYGSIFGDGEDMSLDLCQACVKVLLGNVLHHHPKINWP